MNPAWSMTEGGRFLPMKIPRYPSADMPVTTRGDVSEPVSNGARCALRRRAAFGLFVGPLRVVSSLSLDWKASDRKTAQSVERTISQPLLVCTRETI